MACADADELQWRHVVLLFAPVYVNTAGNTAFHVHCCRGSTLQARCVRVAGCWVEIPHGGSKGRHGQVAHSE